MPFKEWRQSQTMPSLQRSSPQALSGQPDSVIGPARKRCRASPDATFGAWRQGVRVGWREPRVFRCLRQGKVISWLCFVAGKQDGNDTIA